MDRYDELLRRIQELEERLSGLSEASLRINESLDFGTVLQEVVDSARTLTASRYGAITVLGEAGQMPDFIVSGLTGEEHQGLWDMPEGRGFFEYLSGLEQPLRVANIDSHLRALNMPGFLPSVPVISLLVAPIRHQGVGVGTIYLSRGADGREFTQEDEETLVLFAAQAAQVIANARRYREEQRAKADLETLIDTSPVGVVVFDMRKGAAVSFNREGGRIVDGLRNPGQSPEDLLRLLTVRRADGREVSLMEFPLAEALRSADTVRAEEIIMGVPDGRSMTVLLNATPIRSDEGEVESVVVTMQDMAVVEEQERLRAEFLAMVSHELRAPLTSIIGAATTMLNAAADLDPAEMRQFHRIIVDRADHMREIIGDLLDVSRIETGTLAVNPEPAEVTVLVDRARNAFTNTGAGRNNLAIDIEPDLPLVMADRRRIAQVLGNLLSNAAQHSPESSVITVTAVREDLHVAISVSDKGRGFPAESLPHLFRKFSGAQSADQREDIGLGLTICKGIVEAHGGRIWAESDGPNLGARFTFTLPTVEEGSRTAGRFPSTSERSSRRVREEVGEQVTVLVVDDDPQDLRYVRDILRQSGYAPIVTGEPGEALRLMEEKKPQLVLLDLVLPGADGIDLMKEILDVADVPVIFLSAYGRDELIARAFDMGAADYVVKPFSPTELTARIRAALRSRASSEPSKPYMMKDLVIDYSGRRVSVAGRPVRLEAMEYRLLVELSANAGQVLTYEHLLRRVWGEKSGSDVRPMRTIVSKLRRKLGDDVDNPTYIFTETRVGYRMAKGTVVP